MKYVSLILLFAIFSIFYAVPSSAQVFNNFWVPDSSQLPFWNPTSVTDGCAEWSSNSLTSTGSACGAGGSGDSVQVDGTGVDTTANFTNGGQISFTLTDGGAGGPDIITGDIFASSTIEAAGINATSSSFTNASTTALSITGVLSGFLHVNGTGDVSTSTIESDNISATGTPSNSVFLSGASSWVDVWTEAENTSAAYISDITGENLGDLNDVTQTTLGANELLFTQDGSTWINQTLAEAGIQGQDDYLDDIAGISNPASDVILFIDDTDDTVKSLTIGSGLSISGTEITATGGSSLWTDGGGFIYNSGSSTEGVAIGDSASNTAPYLFDVENSQFFIRTANGVDYSPGSDIDVDLATIIVTGTPVFKWDESETAFDFNTIVSSAVGYDCTGAVDCDFGSADLTDLSFTTDGGTVSIDGAFIGALTGNADTATALAANGGNCSAGNAPLGVDDAGAVESCFDVWTEAENTAAAYISGITGESIGDLSDVTITSLADNEFLLSSSGSWINQTATEIESVLEAVLDINQLQGSIAAGQYGAATIDGDDVNSNIAGNYLTLTGASPDTLDVDQEVAEHTATLIWADDGFAASSTLHLHIRRNITAEEFYCYDSGAASGTIQAEWRSVNTPNTASSTNIFSSEISTGGGSVASTTSFANSAIQGPADLAFIMVNASSTTSDTFTCHFNFQGDDI